MTNPNDAVGTNAAYSGGTSVNAFNDGISAYSRGIMSGWACVPNTGLKVSLGGSGNVRDVAIAEDNSGNKTTINNISGSPIDVTLASAPASNSRIDSIVVYVDNPPTGSSSIADNPAACGIIAVKGIVASSPTAPTDNEIRSAITADGASGVTAYYAVLANITIPNGTTDITSGEIIAGPAAAIGSQNLDFASFADYSLSEINTGVKWVDGKNIYKKTINLGSLPDNSIKVVPHNITNLGTLIRMEGGAVRSTDNALFPLPFPSVNSPNTIAVSIDYTASAVDVAAGVDRSNLTGYITLYYTKTS